MHTPFFPDWRHRFGPMGRRIVRLRQQSLLHLDQLFGPFLPPALLAQAEEGPNSRERVFSVRRTFFGFLYQVLNPDCPCREVVRQIQALFSLHARGPVDEATGAYCQARRRLPWDILPRLRCAAAAHAQKACRLQSSDSAICATSAKLFRFTGRRLLANQNKNWEGRLTNRFNGFILSRRLLSHGGFLGQGFWVRTTYFPSSKDCQHLTLNLSLPNVSTSGQEAARPLAFQ